MVERCSLLVCRRRREHPFAMQHTENLNVKQLHRDISETYLKVNCQLVLQNCRMTFKFQSNTAMHLE